MLFLYSDSCHPSGGHELDVIHSNSIVCFFFFPSIKLFLHFLTSPPFLSFRDMDKSQNTIFNHLFIFINCPLI